LELINELYYDARPNKSQDYGDHVYCFCDGLGVCSSL